jgi:type II secretory pathway pseudopilin PulG
MEMIVVLGVLSMLTAIATLNFGGKSGNNAFKKEANEIVNILKTAQNGASQSHRRYSVTFDIVEQTYTMQEVRSIEDLMDQSFESDERTLSTTSLTEFCRVEYITFDDLTDTRDVGDIENQIELKSYFVAGRSGWQNGGMIVLTDFDGNEYTIVVNRMSKSIKLEEGNEIENYGNYLEPKENLTF